MKAVEAAKLRKILLFVIVFRSPSRAVNMTDMTDCNENMSAESESTPAA
jgi:hypothetical protein